MLVRDLICGGGLFVERFVCQDGICFDEVKAKDRRKDREKTDFVLFGKKSNFGNTTFFFWKSKPEIEDGCMVFYFLYLHMCETV